MSLSLYEITVPVMIAGFGNMSKFLDRGRATLALPHHRQTGPLSEEPYKRLPHKPVLHQKVDSDRSRVRAMRIHSSPKRQPPPNL